MSHSLQIRVYYEDTDLAGIVYYANYLKFIERARTEWVRALGVDQARLKAETGIVFAVRRIEADYLSPAHFDDLLDVHTSLREIRGARLILDQAVLRRDAVLFQAVVTLVCLDAQGRAARLPADIRQRIAESAA